MNGNIYCNGKLINKAGIDRIVLNKVVLKKIDKEVFMLAMRRGIFAMMTQGHKEEPIIELRMALNFVI